MNIEEIVFKFRASNGGTYRIRIKSYSNGKHIGTLIDSDGDEIATHRGIFPNETIAMAIFVEMFEKDGTFDE